MNRGLTALKIVVQICLFTIVFSNTVFSQAKQDLAGSKDHPLIKRFSESVIEFYKETKFGTYKLPVNAEGKLEFGKPKELTGKITRIQYSASKESNPEFVLANYKKAFTDSGFTVLTAIANEQLGVGKRSQDWKEKYYDAGGYWKGINNGKFGLGIKIPSWKDKQSFIACSGNIEGVDIYVAVYTIDNGAYTLITQDIIEAGAAKTGLVSINKKAFTAAIKTTKGAAAQAKPDVAGSKDHPLIGRFKGSAIEFYQETQWGTYRLPIADGKLNFKKPQALEGKITRIQYTTSAENNPEFLLSNYKKAFKDSGFKALIALANEQLGVGRRSQDWKEKYYDTGGYWNGINNGRFGLGIQIPREKSKQSFIAGSGNVDGVDVFITVYAIENGKSTLITQDVIEVGAAKTGLVTLDKISKGLALKGHIAIYDIYFDTGKHTIKTGSGAALKIIASYLNTHKDVKFFIVGHTDNAGNYAGNVTLSKNRAETVMGILVTKYSVSPHQLRAEGVASLCPVASNARESGRKMNRRVEIVLQ